MNGQNNIQFNPLSSNDSKKTSVKNQLESAYKVSIKNTKDKEFKEFQEKRQKDLIQQLNYNGFLFDNTFYPLANEVLKEIKQANSQTFNIPAQVLIGRSSIPNAFCYGNGVLVINIGLISRLQNKDQLAFVISHEFSHQVLDHVDKRVIKEIEFKKSKRYKKDIKEY